MSDIDKAIVLEAHELAEKLGVPMGTDLRPLQEALARRRECDAAAEHELDSPPFRPAALDELAARDYRRVNAPCANAADEAIVDKLVAKATPAGRPMRPSATATPSYKISKGGTNMRAAGESPARVEEQSALPGDRSDDQPVPPRDRSGGGFRPVDPGAVATERHRLALWKLVDATMTHLHEFAACPFCGLGEDGEELDEDSKHEEDCPLAGYELTVDLEALREASGHPSETATSAGVAPIAGMLPSKAPDERHVATVRARFTEAAKDPGLAWKRYIAAYTASRKIDVDPDFRKRMRTAFFAGWRASQSTIEDPYETYTTSDRIRDIIDEAFGLQPVMSDEEALTFLEKKLFESRRPGQTGSDGTP